MGERRDVAREGLLRTKPFALEREDGDGDGLTLRGHAAVFNEPTLIDSWEGRFYERISPGAFRKTFRERTPVLQFDHGKHPLVGSIPIGKVREVGEDAVGAYVEARLHDNWLVQPVRDAIAEGSVDGMSFRFSVVREDWHDAEGKPIKDESALLDLMWRGGDDIPTRTLKEVKVPELGPVVFPAYEATDVGVRSGRTVIDLGALRSSPEERAKLARVLWLAEDRSEHPDDVPTAADDDAADETPETPSAPPVVHPEENENAAPPPDGEHPADETPDGPLAEGEDPTGRQEGPDLDGEIRSLLRGVREALDQNPI